MTSFVLSAEDQTRRVGLQRMRAVALGLLVLAACVYGLTHGRDGVWGFVNAAAEAAMIGAIADWFAVTALFRHPLRLPVPHTAIIPRRKVALGQSLERFVADNFLTEETARSRFAAADVPRRVGRWLAQPQHSARVVAELSPLTRRVLARMRDEDIQDFVEITLLPRIRQEPLSAIAGHLLGTVVDDRAHHGLVDIAVRELHDWLRTHFTAFAQILGDRAPWWSPHWLDEKVVERVHREALAWTEEIRDDPGHRVRGALDSLLTDLARDLQHDEQTMARAEDLKERLLTHPQVAPSTVAVWDAIRSVLLEALDDPDGHLRGRATDALVHLGERVVDDEVLAGRVGAWATDAVAHTVRTYGSEVATVISQTVDRWDGTEAAERIELHVGRDLQFIRINGTVVGGLVGLLLHSITVLL